MPRPSPLTPEVQAAFLAEVRSGTLVVKAAAKVGVAISTLYWRRRRDPLFDFAWSAAARLSRDSGTGRRVRFGAEDKSRFLQTLPADCHSAAAARRVRFHCSTVYRHLRRDPAFAGGRDSALASGYERLGRAADSAAEARAGRLRAGLETASPPDIRGEDCDSLARRLDRYTRPDGSIGDRKVRRPAARHVWTFEEAIVALDRALDATGLRRDPFPDED